MGTPVVHIHVIWKTTGSVNLYPTCSLWIYWPNTSESTLTTHR